jgi:hypothetical protein
MKQLIFLVVLLIGAAVFVGCGEEDPLAPAPLDFILMTQVYFNGTG